MLPRALSFLLHLLILAPGVLADPITVDVPYPPPHTCNTVSLKWGGGTPPYNVTIAGYMAVTFFNEPSTTDTSASWVANATGGTPVIVLLYDATGMFGASEFFLVGPSNDTSCLPDKGHQGDALSAGAIAGIAVAGAAVCAIGLGAAFWTRTRRRGRGNRRHAKPEGTTGIMKNWLLSHQLVDLFVEIDLNESSLPPTVPQTSMKAALASWRVVHAPQSPSHHTDDSTSSLIVLDSSSGQEAPNADTAGIQRGHGHHDDIQPLPPGHPLSIPPLAQKLGAAGPSISLGTTTPQTAGRDHVTAGAGGVSVVPSHPDVPRHEEDGGIRLAGGPIDEIEETTATLPPPYRRY
ncbi:hypothetical protein OH77DRAFT_1519775 [Trametes cingulata]|nr:hypothetical protein OH77DRAFT_1519775 [Trametes cingulata]